MTHIPKHTKSDISNSMKAPIHKHTANKNCVRNEGYVPRGSCGTYAHT